MANIIKPKRSNTAAKVPTTSDLASGELGVNMADKKTYINNGTTVVQIGAGELSGLGDVSISSPTNGQSLVYNGTVWVNQAGAGSGDVTGPASATDNALVRFDGTTGKVIQNSTATLDDSGNLDVTSAKADYYDVDTAASAPAYSQGRTFWDSGNGTTSTYLNADVTLQNGQEIVTLVYNGTGSTITNGSVVAVAGAQGQRPSVVLADADTESTSASTLGIATQDIANGAEGFVTSFGFIRGIDTSAFTAGAPIYLSQTAGQFTATRPLAPAHTVFLGWVIKVNASSGEVFVHISNGWELSELHDVRITSPIGGNLLAYDQTNSYWKNILLTDGTGISVTETTGGAITITNTAPDQTVTLTQGGATTITGTYPNFTISSVNTTYSAATSTVAGLIELNSDTVQSIAANAVTSTASRTYGLQVNAAGQGVINVPWTDTVYTLPAATSTVLGGIELGSDTVQTVAANAVTATASRTYALQVNASGQAVVNVPWTDTNSGGTVTSVAALTLGTTGTDLSSTVANSTTTPVITLNVPTASATNRGALSSADWSTFNGKQAAYTNLTSIGSLANGAGWLYNNGSGVFSYSTPTKTDVGLSNVTNDAQTRAAIVPNTTPTAGQILVGNAGGTAYAPVSASGDATLASTGAITLATVNTNVGSFTNANITVDAKGRITAASNGTASGGTVTSVSGTGTVNGLTLTGTVTTSGSLTLGGNLTIAADMIYDTFLATAGQTTFTTSQTYTSGKIEVFVNGVKMRNGSDVTVTSGTSVVFASGLTLNDEVDLVYPI